MQYSRILGKAIRGFRDDAILATKVSCQMGSGKNDIGLSRRNILSSVDASLSRLGTDYIDFYYMHLPDQKTCIEESLEAMSGLVKAGKIRYYGVSNFPAWQIADMLAICEKRNAIPPSITQYVYNLITRGVETELIPFLKAHRIGLAVFNPIAGGLLTGKHNPEKPAENTRFANSSMYLDRYWSAENFSAVEKLMEIASRHGISILQLAMKWCAAQDSVTSIISGVSSLTQIEQNISSLEGPPLDHEILRECDEIWASLKGNRFGYIRYLKD